MSNVAWRMAEHAAKKVKEGVEEFQNENEEALRYKVIHNIKVVRKAPKEFFLAPTKVVQGYLDSKVFLWSTNEEIMEIVTDWVPHYPLPSNFMDKALSAKQLTAIGIIMAKAGLAFDRKVHNSLSKIKLAVQAGKSAADAELVFVGKIAFGKDYVTVGTKRYPFTADATYRRIKVGSQKIRVDVLQALLEGGNLPSSTS